MACPLLRRIGSSAITRPPGPAAALLAISCRSVPFQVGITLAKVLAIYRVPVPRHSWKVIDVSFRIYPNDDVFWTLQRCRRRAIFSKIFGESSVRSKCGPQDRQQPDSQSPHPIGHHLPPSIPLCAGASNLLPAQVGVKLRRFYRTRLFNIDHIDSVIPVGRSSECEDCHAKPRSARSSACA